MHVHTCILKKNYLKWLLFSTQQKPKNNAIALKKNVTKFIHLYIAFHLKKEKKIQYMHVNNYITFQVYVVKCLRRAWLSIDWYLNVFVKVVLIQ